MDFTVEKFGMMLEALAEAGYGFQTFSGFLNLPPDPAPPGNPVLSGNPTHPQDDSHPGNPTHPQDHSHSGNPSHPQDHSHPGPLDHSQDHSHSGNPSHPKDHSHPGDPGPGRSGGLSPHYTPGRVVVLRHDVDRLPGNALRLARLEAGMGIAATYFFRIVPQSFDRDTIRAIHELGHEIGYHYEDLSLMAATGWRSQFNGSSATERKSRFIGKWGKRPDSCFEPATATVHPGDSTKSSKGMDLLDLAIDSFRRNLETLREIAPVKTACMHGSPLSRFDNRMIWEEFDYRDYGILGEPYFDVDYSRVWYITDTGRSWGRKDANIRDRVDSGFELLIRNTDHLIRLTRSEDLPDRIIINTHPQRWNDPGYRWLRELALQNVKNVLKSILIRYRSYN